jgi:oxygen-independent coproporphyrinogen-3 oxidase
MGEKRLELLKKYDVAAPRYTSYPTVPAWREEVTADDFRASLKEVAVAAPLSLYFHLPFCEKLCHFCGCMQVITQDRSRSQSYVDHLRREIGLVARELGNARRPVSQIHLGGGTPNFIQPDELSALMAAVWSRFHVLPDAEIAVEMHPRTATPAFCERLKTEGFNRISLGVQDFDDEVQRLINRFQTFAQTRDVVALLRALGFTHFNFDLIYGLPGQRLDGFRRTLNLTLSLHPDRLAIYSYAHVPWVRKVQRTFKDADLPTPELKLTLAETAKDFFVGHGYAAIGMDHYARAEDDLTRAFAEGSIHRNFMGYSTRADAHQIGFGVSAISLVNGNYFQNSKDLGDYQDGIDVGRLTTIRGFLSSADDALRRALITRLMCHGGVDLTGVGRDFGITPADYFREDFTRLAGMIADGLVELTADRLTVTPPGRFALRNVAMCFDRYLDGIRTGATTPVFSRTV